jgi:DNA-binding PadR family transcriptional regulator
LTPTEAAILGLLQAGEQSGYTLSRRVERSVGYFWAPVQSRMYATLPGLVERGFARSREVVESNRLKQLYRITRAGRAAFRAWLREKPGEDTGKNELLLKIFLGEGVGEDDALLQHVRVRRERVEEIRRELEQLDADGAGEEQPHARLTRSFGLRWCEMWTDWADEVERELAPARLSRR